MVFDAAICIQGKYNGEEWIYNDETLLSYFNWAADAQTTHLANRLLMIHDQHLDNAWKSSHECMMIQIAVTFVRRGVLSNCSRGFIQYPLYQTVVIFCLYCLA